MIDGHGNGVQGAGLDFESVATAQ